MKNSDIIQIQLPADAFRVLVVSDLHGRPQLLERLLKRADYRPGEDYLLILGDLIEKGPDSPGALKLAYRLAQNDRVYAIRGNKGFHKFPSKTALFRFCRGRAVLHRFPSPQRFDPICRTNRHKNGQFRQFGGDSEPFCV